MNPVHLAQRQGIPASEAKVTQERMTSFDLRRAVMSAIALNMLYVVSMMVLGYNGYDRRAGVLRDGEIIRHKEGDWSVGRGRRGRGMRGGDNLQSNMCSLYQVDVTRARIFDICHLILIDLN